MQPQNSNQDTWYYPNPNLDNESPFKRQCTQNSSSLCIMISQQNYQLKQQVLQQFPGITISQLLWEASHNVLTLIWQMGIPEYICCHLIFWGACPNNQCSLSHDIIMLSPEAIEKAITLLQPGVQKLLAQPSQQSWIHPSNSLPAYHSPCFLDQPTILSTLKCTSSPTFFDNKPVNSYSSILQVSPLTLITMCMTDTNSLNNTHQDLSIAANSLPLPKQPIFDTAQLPSLSKPKSCLSQPQCEYPLFQGLRYSHPSTSHHPAYPIRLKSSHNMCPVACGPKWSLKQLQDTVYQGYHPSAKIPEAMICLCKGLL